MDHPLLLTKILSGCPYLRITLLVLIHISLILLENTQIQFKESSNLSIITAPVSGTLLNVKGLEEGSFIAAGIQLAEISPKTDLIVECYINPTDIGLLKKENKVNFQVSAFNYNQWGLASGTITGSTPIYGD